MSLDDAVLDIRILERRFKSPSTGDSDPITQIFHHLPSELSLADRCLFALYGVGPQRLLTTLPIHFIFSRHAQARPDSLAATYLGTSISYAQLDDVSNRLAVELAGRGVRRGDRVVLVVQRSLYMLVGILGTLKAGAAYIPLDGGVVTDHTLSFILQDSGATFALYTSPFHERISSTLPSICLDKFLFCPSDKATSYTVETTSPSDEAYVIYTSGTTGTPKGVSVSHRNVTNLLCTSPGNLGIRPGVKVAQILSISFDMCVWEILGCLLNGGTLIIRGSTREHWEHTLRNSTVLITTPTILQRYNPADYMNIRVVATAGEPCPESLANAWSTGRIFYNGCGPTETTIVNTMHKHIRGTKITIGVPTPNNRVYVLDVQRRPLPIGAIGIMWAAGAGVSRGYINHPGLTERKYVLDPFCNDGMMYNTGDLGRWNSCGELEHMGRIDDQVKIRGFRVELDGVAAVIASHPSVLGAVTLVVEAQLCGVFTPASTNTDDVMRFVSEHLPFYAVPTRYLAMDNFPMTINGKVDKQALRAVLTCGGHTAVEDS